LHCNKTVNASEALYRPAFRGIQGEAKQTLRLPRLRADTHFGVQASRPAKARLLAMTTFGYSK